MPRALKCQHEQQYVANIKVRCLKATNRVEITPVAICDIHKRCLPHFRGPWGEAQREYEAKQYVLCHLSDGTSCPDYQPRR
jgi:hypothetical protein